MQLQLITAALNARCEEICKAFFGPPTMVNQFEQRFGRHQSKSLRTTGPKRGFFFDHEIGKGGDMLTLICIQHGVGIREALEVAQRDYLGSTLPPPKPAQVAPVSEPSDESKLKAAQRMFDEGRPL